MIALDGALHEVVKTTGKYFPFGVPKMHRTNFSTDEIPIEVREKARHLWASIKNLVEVKKPEDEQNVVVLIASCLVMYTMLGDLTEHIRQSPGYQRMLEEIKKGMDRDPARGMKEFRAALDEHMKGVNGIPVELRDRLGELPIAPHSLREDFGMKDQIDMVLAISKECPCHAHGHRCSVCEYAREIREAVDAEIERRKKLKKEMKRQ